jgi:hypothetical protein
MAADTRAGAHADRVGNGRRLPGRYVDALGLAMALFQHPRQL